MSAGNEILGWGVAAVVVGGIIKFARDYDKIGTPTKGASEPFDTPELNSSRAEVEARMKKLNISTTENCLPR